MLDIFRVLVVAGLALIPVLIFGLNWKYSDRQRRFSQNFSRVILVAWIALVAMAGGLLWHDRANARKTKARIEELTAGQEHLQLQNAKLLAEIAQYRAEVGPRNFEELEPIVKWGVAPPNKIQLVVDTESLKHYADRFSIIALCRVRDDAVDFFSDRRIMKSEFFRIHGSRTPIELEMDEEFLGRLMGTTLAVQCRVALLPHGANIGDVQMASDVGRIGGVLHPRSRSARTALRRLNGG